MGNCTDFSLNFYGCLAGLILVNMGWKIKQNSSPKCFKNQLRKLSQFVVAKIKVGGYVAWASMQLFLYLKCF